MLNPEFEVIIHKEPWNGSVGILFVERRGERVYVGKPVDIVMTELKPHEAVMEPTLRIHRMDSDGFLQALAKALDDRGVKTDADAKKEGLLEATKYHLEDLRHLLKLRGDK